MKDALVHKGTEGDYQPQRNERTQRIVQANILPLWLWVLVVESVFCSQGGSRGRLGDQRATSNEQRAVIPGTSGWNPEPGTWKSREKITNRKRSKRTQRSGQVIKCSSCLCVVVVKNVLCSQGGSPGCRNESRRGGGLRWRVGSVLWCAGAASCRFCCPGGKRRPRISRMKRIRGGF